MSDLTYEQWEEKYLPITNYITNEGFAYETYGDEVNHVAQQDEHYIWTEMDGDNGVYLVNGFHYVNRIQYYITTNPWSEGDDVCITICEYVVCSCYNEETDEANADCDECGGDGTYTDWKY